MILIQQDDDVAILLDIVKTTHQILIKINDEGDFVVFPVLFVDCVPGLND